MNFALRTLDLNSIYILHRPTNLKNYNSKIRGGGSKAKLTLKTLGRGRELMKMLT